MSNIITLEDEQGGVSVGLTSHTKLMHTDINHRHKATFIARVIHNLLAWVVKTNYALNCLLAFPHSLKVTTVAIAVPLIRP